MLRRDDPNPAPWTKAGKKKIKELGLNMVVRSQPQTSMSYPILLNSKEWKLKYNMAVKKLPTFDDEKICICDI